MNENPENPAVPAVALRYGKLYEMLLEAIPFSVLLILPSLRIHSANRNFLNKSQKALPDVVGHRIEDVFPAVICEQMAITRRIRNVFETNHPVEGDRMTYRAPGVPLRIYYYSLLPFIWQGRTEGVLLLMNDMTEQVRLGEEVRRVEQHLASIVDSASDLILSTDLAGRILTWNTTAERLSGYAAAEARGRSFAEFCAGESADIQGVFARDGVQSREWLFKTRQSELLLVAWGFSPLLDHQGQAVGVVCVGRDLTERRKFEMELVQSQKMAALGVMAGGIAHEIRNPLASCSSAAQFLADEKVISPEFLRECAETIRRGVRRASTIIENLLRYAHPDTPIHPSPVNLVDLITETLALVAAHARLNQVETGTSFASAPAMVQGVGTLLQQVFMNLFLNAIQAMPTGGRLQVVLDMEDGGLRVRVIDSGCGIRKENIQKVFDPFYTTSTAKDGTGLGLAICYTVMKQHGGSIAIESNVGSGCTVTVRFPRPGASRAGSESRPSHVSLPGGHETESHAVFSGSNSIASRP